MPGQDDDLSLVNTAGSLQNFLQAMGYTIGDGCNYTPGDHYKDDNDFYTRMLFAAKAIMASGTADEREKLTKDLLRQLALARYSYTQEQIIMVLCDRTGFSDHPISTDYILPFLSDAVREALEAQTFVYIQFLPFLVLPGIDTTIDSSTIDQLMFSDIPWSIESALDLLLSDNLSIDVRIRLAHALGMIHIQPLYEQLLGLLINNPPRRHKKLEAFVGRYIALALSTFSAPSDDDLRRIEEYIVGSQSITRLVQWAMIDVLGQRGAKGSYVAIAALQRLLQDSRVHVLVQWHILLVLYDLVSKEEFKYLSNSLQNSLSRYIDTMEERFQPQLQLVRQGIVAMESGINRFAQNQVEKIRECMGKNMVSLPGGEPGKAPVQQYEQLEDLIFRLDTVGHLYGKKGDGQLRLAEEQDPVEAALEELLTICSNREVCDHIHYNLQRINRRIRGLKIKMVDYS